MKEEDSYVFLDEEYRFINILPFSTEWFAKKHCRKLASEKGLIIAVCKLIDVVNGYEIRDAELPLEPTKSIQAASLPEEEKCLFCHEYDCRCTDYDRAQLS